MLALMTKNKHPFTTLTSIPIVDHFSGFILLQPRKGKEDSTVLTISYGLNSLLPGNIEKERIYR